MLEQLQSLGYLDWVTTILALVYVYLAARNSPWCWLFGAVGCAIWCYVDIVDYKLYSDAALQAFYVVMSFIGLYQWQKGGEAQTVLPVSSMTLKEHAWLIAVCLLAGLLLGYFVSQHFAAAATYPDAITTTFSIGATIMLLRRKVENWLYWIIIDIAYVGIYASRGATLFMLIMLVYVGVAIYGYKSWQKEPGI